jgi:hypothetical protein
MTAERAAAPVQDDEPLTVGPATAGSATAGSAAAPVAVPLTLPFIGAVDPLPTAAIPLDVAELLGETISSASGPGVSAATARPPIR